MENINHKYPRTYHLPWSPGTTSDDKKLSGDWFKYYMGKEIVITEKLDGENICINRNDVFARSHGAPTRNPWSKNIWGDSGLFWRVRNLIGEDEWIYGENLFGIHSIIYENLPAYYHIFGIRDDKSFVWMSWDDVKAYSSILGLPHVPELWRGIINSEDQLKDLVIKYTQGPSTYGSTIEGIVLRNTCEFPIDEFSKNVCKWVRPNHVQTDKHWTENWKQAKLIEK